METQFNSSAVRNEVMNMQLESNNEVKTVNKALDKGYLYLIGLGVAFIVVLTTLSSLGLISNN